MTNRQLIQFCHSQAHNTAHDHDDTVVMALTRRDCWVICMGAFLTEMAFPCLSVETRDLRVRLAELLEVQKDNWRAPPET